MRFNLWLVILLAVMPAFILFVGLSAAGGFTSAVDWKIMIIFASAGAAVAYFAKRNEDEAAGTAQDDDAATMVDATPAPTADDDVDESECCASPPCFMPELDTAWLAGTGQQTQLGGVDNVRAAAAADEEHEQRQQVAQL